MMSEVGSPGLLLTVWLLAGVITLFGALTNAEISGMIPETGGQFVFFERMYGPFVAFLYGWAAFKLVAADAAEAVFAGGGKWIAALVMISTFGTNNAVILASARIYYSMAKHGVAPAKLGTAHPTFHTPGTSLTVQCTWAVVLILSGTFDMLTDMLVFVAWIFYAAGAFGVFVLRRKMPDAPRPYRVPGYPVVPALFVVFATVFLALTIYNDLTTYQKALAAGQPAVINSAFGLLLIAAGTPIYLLYQKRR